MWLPLEWRIAVSEIVCCLLVVKLVSSSVSSPQEEEAALLRRSQQHRHLAFVDDFNLTTKKTETVRIKEGLSCKAARHLEVSFNSMGLTSA